VKPSEIGSGSGEMPQRKLNFPVDDRAEPPISIEEALAAGSALCIRHGGLIGQRGGQGGDGFSVHGLREVLALRVGRTSLQAKAQIPGNRSTLGDLRSKLTCIVQTAMRGFAVQIKRGDAIVGRVEPPPIRVDEVSAL